MEHLRKVKWSESKTSTTTGDFIFILVIVFTIGMCLGYALAEWVF